MDPPHLITITSAWSLWPLLSVSHCPQVVPEIDVAIRSFYTKIIIITTSIIIIMFGTILNQSRAAIAPTMVLPVAAFRLPLELRKI